MNELQAWATSLVSHVCVDLFVSMLNAHWILIFFMFARADSRVRKLKFLYNV